MKLHALLILLPLSFGMCRCAEPKSGTDAPATPEGTRPHAAGSEPGRGEGDVATVPRPLAATDASFDGWTLRVTEEAGFELGFGHAPVVESAYLFFDRDWKWAGAKPEAVDAAQNTFRIASNLPVVANLDVDEQDERTLRFRYEFVVEQPLRQSSGLGLELRIAGASGDGAVIGKPVLRPNNGGISIPTHTTADPVVVEVVAPKGRVYFERGDPGKVRVVFLSGDVPRGNYRGELLVRLPEGGKAIPSAHARYGSEDAQAWLEGATTWDDWPVDLRFLSEPERPAGKHGKVRARGGELVFEDGTPARFWGANVAAYSLFTGSDEDVARQAQRIAALGFNLVRIHHHDSHWQQINVFAPKPQSTTVLDDKALERLDWWIKCLEDEGIYVWIDIHVGRQFRSNDGIAEFAELERNQKGQAKGFNYVNPKIEALMADFTARYLQRKNRYTGKRWADDPGIVTVLVTNENDLADHFGFLFAPDKDLPQHRRLFERQAKDIADALDLPQRQALRLWEPGPAKVLLAELQHRFDARALEQLARMGVDVPVATTSYWGRNGLWAMPPLLAGSILDSHSYGVSEALDLNPRHRSNWIHFIAGARATGMPFAVSEWNVPARERDRFTAATYIASIGAFQGWNSLVLYCYNQDPLREPRKSSEFSAWVDPAMLAMLPTAALMFRRQDVRPARETVVLAPSEDDVFGQKRNAETSLAIRTVAERHRLEIQLPKVEALRWLEPAPAPAGAEVVTDLDHDFLAADAREVVSDTGEIRRSWAAGVQTIDTPRSQVATGWIGRQRVELGDVAFTITNPKAAVAVTSLDGAPIATSKRMLLTMVGRSTADPQTGRWRSEPIAGKVELRTSHRLRATPLGPRARGRVEPGAATLPASPGERGTQILDVAQPTSHWYLIEAVSP